MRGKRGPYKAITRHVALVSPCHVKDDMFRVILVRLFELILRTIGLGFLLTDADMNDMYGGARLCRYGKCKI